MVWQLQRTLSPLMNDWFEIYFKIKGLKKGAPKILAELNLQNLNLREILKLNEKRLF
jgi:hypothetical protein